MNRKTIAICESGPANKVAEYLGFTAEKLAELLNK